MVLALLVVLSAGVSRAASYSETEQLYYSGQYEKCIAVASEEVEGGIWNDRWSRLLIRCLMTTGRYQEALEVYQGAIKKFGSRSLPLRMLGLDVYRMNGQAERARQEQAAIFESIRLSPVSFSSSENLVALGRYFTLMGEDARKILELFYDRAKRSNPSYAEVYVAAAELAIEKTDFQLAAENLERATQLRDDDPYIYYLLAKAWESSDSEKAMAFLERALRLNPKHLPSLHLQAEKLADSEEYDAAREVLAEALAVNLSEPRTWALLAAMEHLQGRYQNEKLHRAAALSDWGTNPAVDHEIGRQLSRHYRFAEAAEYQRQALELEPQFAPARFALAQDLLRLGKHEEGWRMAERVSDSDPYNVVAHNLAQLYDRITQFATLERGQLVVRMDAREAEIYGDVVLDLLEEAVSELLTKYDVAFPEEARIFLEIFPRQEDFAIRTFGLPGGAGFLGVCFGRVITMNSPATMMSNPQNWQSVVWHEFCHAVTLEKSRNRMPRWLSEGISVYEERLRNEAWGQPMSATYREMLLGDDFTPLSELSAAFLRPPSQMHLQFAYFESALAVEFLVDRFGQQTLNRILDSLASGLSINESLARYAGDLQTLDREFESYARQQAEEFGAEADWQRPGEKTAADRLSELFPDLELPGGQSLEDYAREQQGYGVEVGEATSDSETELADDSAGSEAPKETPVNYWLNLGGSIELLSENKADEAIELLEPLQEAVPNDVAAGGVLRTLSVAYRRSGQVEKERQVLRDVVAGASDVFDQLLRLIEIEEEAERWEEVARHAETVLAMNPLVPTGYVALSEAAEQLERPVLAARALHGLAQLDPVDPAGIHYRLAAAYEQLGQQDQAERAVLKALEDAPRYREALRLLLRVTEVDATDATDAEAESAGDASDSAEPQQETEADAGDAAAPATTEEGDER